MSDDTTDIATTDVARRLLAALYHNPQHIGRVAAEDPTMPDATTDRLWDVMTEVHDAGSLDTARVSALVSGLNGDGAGAGCLLGDIRHHETLGAVEAARYGHDGAQLEEWGRQLAEHGAKERLATRLGALVRRIEESGPDLSLEEIQAGLIEEIQGTIGEAATDGLRHVSDFVDGALEDTRKWEDGEVASFVRTGFYSLDEKITGVPVGELTIFAAHSGAGKTSWLIQLLRQVALQSSDQAVCFFSIEMPATKILHRAAAACSGHELSVVREHPESLVRGTPRAERHRQALRALEDLPLYIDDDPEPTVSQIYSRVMQVQARHDVTLIGVDYDEKVDPEAAPQNEEQRVGAISKGLKVIAKELDAACVALSQYNSSPSSQIRPGTDDDLRYSRKKKHEAHTTLHWYWPAYWLRSGIVDLESGDEAPDHYNPEREELGRLYVGKGREGGLGWVPLEFHAEHTRFVDPNDPENKTEPANAEAF